MSVYSNNIFLVGGHGLGDSLLSLSCAYFINHKTNISKTAISCTRDEVFKPLKFLVDNYLNFFLQIFQHPEKEKWGENNYILSHKDEMLKWFNQTFEYVKEDNVYYVIPDLLYRNPLAFDYERFSTHPQLIKSHRLFTKGWQPENMIYLGLLSNTEGYSYPFIKELALKLSRDLPEYKIYLPIMGKWANKSVPEINFSGEKIPENLILDYNPDFISSIKIMAKSCYGIYTCNGPSHIAYHLGQPRLLLDPRYGFGRNALPWVARWRETFEESVPITTNIIDVCNLVKTNLLVSQTSLIPRSVVLANLDANWSRELIFKF